MTGGSWTTNDDAFTAAAATGSSHRRPPSVVGGHRLEQIGELEILQFAADETDQRAIDAFLNLARRKAEWLARRESASTATRG